MAFDINIRGRKSNRISSKWMNEISPNMIELTKKALFDSLNDFDPSFEDYVGISHQVQAIELGYTDF